MPNSSYVIRTAPLAEALAHFVLRVDVVCAMQTRAANLVGRRPGIGVPKLGDLKARSNLTRKILILRWVLLAYLKSPLILGSFQEL